jgi:hypothetical protein
MFIVKVWELEAIHCNVTCIDVGRIYCLSIIACSSLGFSVWIEAETNRNEHKLGCIDMFDEIGNS